MLKELFIAMFKEEMRMHTALYKSRSFFSFPLLMLVLAFFISYGFINFSLTAQSDTDSGIIVLFVFFASGIMSGAFGLHAKDYLERRFGDFGKLFSNVLLLPISLKGVFLVFAVKDIVFYMIWFILPVVLGHGIALAASGLPFLGLPFFFLALSFSFAYGIFSAFFLSVLYERSRILFSLLVLLLFIFPLLFFFQTDLTQFFPPVLFYLQTNFLNFLILCFGLLFLGLLCYITIKADFSEKTMRKAKERKSMSFDYPIDPFMIKDYIDLKRTGGLFAKPFLNVFLPSLLLLALFSSIRYLVDFETGILFFAIAIGTLSTTLFNSLVTSDAMAYYKFLPVELEQYMRTKFILSYLIASLQGVFLLFIFAWFNGEFLLFFQAILLFTSIYVFNLMISFYLTGLNPNEFLLNAWVFLRYGVFFVPVLLVGMLLSLLAPSNLFFHLLFLAFALLCFMLIFPLALRKWKNMEEIK
jgi:hypothetical protein